VLLFYSDYNISENQVHNIYDIPCNNWKVGNMGDKMIFSIKCKFANSFLLDALCTMQPLGLMLVGWKVNTRSIVSGKLFKVEVRNSQRT